MKAHKTKVTIPEHHQVGAESQQQMRRALQELRAIQWTPEEERVLNEFEEFQWRHPIDLSSLTEEEP